MPSPLADVYDVQALMMRQLSDEEQTSAAQLIDYASALVRSQVPTVDDRLASGALSETVVKVVVGGVVARAMRNPAGVRQRSVGSLSETYDAVDSGITLTADDVRQLRGRAPARRFGTIRLSPGLGA